MEPLLTHDRWTKEANGRKEEEEIDAARRFRKIEWTAQEFFLRGFPPPSAANAPIINKLLHHHRWAWASKARLIGRNLTHFTHTKTDAIGGIQMCEFIRVHPKKAKSTPAKRKGNISR